MGYQTLFGFLVSKKSLQDQTLDQAFTHRKPSKGLMHHSDLGCQYTSKYFKDFMKEHVDFFKYRTREEAINSIFEY